ncbi:tetratricopeptide repeat protein [Chitinophaga sedimenti]|uniref:tetratricopeptide repeat protein n=1 Tax=Chitinophaga sedimenti TaxID=2033606 RepID=UPI002004E425|nr:tetratricopeptide repeat protein [Chitinophaga sedimenti]MCK7558854.1 tetratricopeptide repeat protein [Chitinophaga sedimenti]
MQKSQLILIGGAIALVATLFIYGRTSPVADKKAAGEAMPGQPATVAAAKFEDILQKAKEKAPAAQLAEINSLEHAVVRGDVKSQQIAVNRKLYEIWEGLNEEPVAAYYAGEAAKLENSEKSLTFAANLFFKHYGHAKDAAVMKWQAEQAVDLFDKAIALTTPPKSDTLKYYQSQILLETGEPMAAVSKLREIVQNNPDNEDAQITLGNMAITSGQFDKAIERMDGFLKRNPKNAKAMFILAEAYRSKGDKDKAIALFKQSRALIADPTLGAEIDKYIESIK